MKRNGFTLAEVLVTLGVIGIVAAITMPTLIKNYQKNVWVNQLKKSISVVENGFKLAMAESGTDKLEDTEFFIKCSSYDIADGGDTDNIGSWNCFADEMKKYFKIIDNKFYYNYHEKYKSLDGSAFEDDDSDGALYLSDGTIIYILIYWSGEKSARIFAIDVNGEKGPNVAGRDLFPLYLGFDGKLSPIDNQHQGSCWGSNISCDPKTKSGYNGNGCAARIMENGWKMDY